MHFKRILYRKELCIIMDTNITLQTKQMIDNLKAVCTNYGLGNASSEYKILTEVFLYKFLRQYRTEK